MKKVISIIISFAILLSTFSMINVSAAGGKTYYLFGYINGADYADKADADNMGVYRFVNNQITVNFSEESYVGVKEEGNANWYMTNGWQGKDATSVTLYNTNNLGANADKMYIPANVDITLNLVDNGNGTLTLWYDKPEERDVRFELMMLVAEYSFGVADSEEYYTPESFAVFKEAYNYANNLLSDRNTTDAQYEEAYQRLLNARNSLVRLTDSTQTTKPTESSGTNIVPIPTDPYFDALNELSFKISEAENVAIQYNAYTKESLQRLWDAIDYAKELIRSETATAEDFLAQIEALQNAIDALEALGDMNKDELWEVIQRADAFIEREGKYPEVDYTEFQEASLRATAVFYYGQSQEEIDSAKEALEAELNKLEKIHQDIKNQNTTSASDPTESSGTNIVPIPPDPYFDALNELSYKIWEAQNAVAAGNNFTVESRQRVWDAINYANELIRSETATAEDFLAQIEVLQNAIDALEVPDINTDELWEVIERAEAFIEREGKYPDVDYTEFQEAGLRARVAYHYGQSQEEVDSAKEALEAALNNLEKIYQDIKNQNTTTSTDPTTNEAVTDPTEITQPTGGTNDSTSEQTVPTDIADTTANPTTEDNEPTEPDSESSIPTTDTPETTEPTTGEVVTDPTETEQPTEETSESTSEQTVPTDIADTTANPTTEETESTEPDSESSIPTTETPETTEPTTEPEGTTTVPADSTTESTESTTEATESPTESIRPTTSATEQTEPSTTPKVKAKKANKMKVTVKTKTVKVKKLRKGKVTVKAITVKNNNGAVTFKKVAKKSAKCLSINKKTGKITVKKGTKKGTYKINVKITAKGDKNYESKTLTKTIKIKVK